MLILLAALIVGSVAPRMVTADTAVSMNKCPAGWTEHRPDGKRICYKYATWNEGEQVDHTDATKLCAALHAGSTLPMPKTKAQREVLKFYTKFDTSDGDIMFDYDFVGMDVDPTSGDHKWVDGESVDLERFGDIGTCSFDECRVDFSEYYASGEATGDYHTGFGYRAADDTHVDGKQLCQIIIKQSDAAVLMDKCPAEWTEHQPDGQRICYKYATWNEGEQVDHTDATLLCAALHAGSTLPMPKTAAQREVLKSYTKFDTSDYDIGFDYDFVGMDVDPTSGDHKWVDGESVDPERIRDIGTCSFDECRVDFSEYYASGEATGDYHTGFGYRAADDIHVDGKQLCQIIIKQSDTKC